MKTKIEEERGKEAKKRKEMEKAKDLNQSTPKLNLQSQEHLQ